MPVDSQPLVSIVIPSFNQGPFIKDTLDSVLKQDYPKVEVIVVDGGSTDETLEILRDHQERIRFISEPDGGQSEAVNKGFRIASGSVIGWLNSDDIYLFRDTISSMVDAFRKDDSVDVLYGDYVRISESNAFMRPYHVWRRYDFGRLMRVCYISQPTVFFRASVVKKEFLDESLHYGMDIEYWLRLGYAGYAFRHTGRIVAAERIHASAKTVARPADSVREGVELRTKYTATRPQHRSILRKNASDHFGMACFRIKAVFTLVSMYLRRDTVIELGYRGFFNLLFRQFF